MEVKIKDEGSSIDIQLIEYELNRAQFKFIYRKLHKEMSSDDIDTAWVEFCIKYGYENN